MNKKVAEALIDADVVKFGDFTLVSGMKTPIYVDLRVIPSFPKSMETITNELSKLIEKLNPDVVAGAETAGIPFSTGVSLKTKIPMIYVRKKPKNYGTRESVEGVLKKDSKVVLIDDMVTNGFSKVKFIDGIKQSGGIVNDVVIVLDRGQGATENLSEKKINLYSLITLKEVLKFMKEKNLIDEKKYIEILDYLEKNK